MSPDGRMYGLDVHPDRIKNYLSYSLKRLGLDYIDIYMPARIDQGIPVEDTIGEISKLVKEGFIKEVGLSQIDVNTLNRAEKIHHIPYVESNYSLFNREIEKELLQAQRKNNTKTIAFGVLAHGLLTDEYSEKIKTNHYIPIFNKENLPYNLKLVDNLKLFANQKGISLTEISTAWVLSKGKDIIPIIGMSNINQFYSAQKAINIELTSEDIKNIEHCIPENEIKGLAFPKMMFKNGKVIL